MLRVLSAQSDRHTPACSRLPHRRLHRSSCKQRRVCPVRRLLHHRKRFLLRTQPLVETERAPYSELHRPRSMQLRIWTPGAHLRLHSMACGAEALLELPLGPAYPKHCRRHMRLCCPHPYPFLTGASLQAAAAILPLSTPFMWLQTA